MGRPPLGIKLTTLRLDPDICARIDALMGGPNRRSRFIRIAILREVERVEREMAKLDRSKLGVIETPEDPPERPSTRRRRAKAGLLKGK